MSLRAIRKKELNSVQHGRFKKSNTVSLDGDRLGRTYNSHRERIVVPSKRTKQKRSMSMSALEQSHSPPHPSPVRERSKSETDISKGLHQILSVRQSQGVISAKSEVCIKTLAVHSMISSTSSSSTNSTNQSMNAVNQRLHHINLEKQRRQSSQISSTLSSRTASQQTIPVGESELQQRGFADMSNIRVPIIGYEVMEERARFTVFKLRVENPFTNNCWIILRRYTDFVRLHSKLKTLFPSLNLSLPKKKLFGDNFDSVFLDNRIQGLQTYVNTIMANDTLRNTKMVRNFLCLDEKPSYSESIEECRALFEAQEETIAHLKIQLKAKDDLILALKEKLCIEMHEKIELCQQLREYNKSCTKSAKDIENYIKTDPSFK